MVLRGWAPLLESCWPFRCIAIPEFLLAALAGFQLADPHLAELLIIYQFPNASIVQNSRTTTPAHLDADWFEF